MLVMLPENVITEAERRMLEAGELDDNLLGVLDAAARIRECDCTPLYLMDMSDLSINVFVAETYDRSRLH